MNGMTRAKVNAVITEATAHLHIPGRVGNVQLRQIRCG